MTEPLDKPTRESVIVIGPSPDEIGGMASVVKQMTSLTCKRRFQFTLLSLTRRADNNESFPSRIVRHGRQTRTLVKLIREKSAAIVHIHTCSGYSFLRSSIDMFVAQRCGCRVVLHIHGAMFDSFVAKKGRVMRRLIRFALTRSDSLIALSQDWAVKLRHIAPAARVTVIENAVEVPALRTRSNGTGPCKFILLARMDEWKGIDDLLDACVELARMQAPFSLTLAGPGGTAGDADTLNQKIADRGLLTVHYVGPIYGEQKAQLLATADAYVQSSHHEGMPISILEALANGLPIVATRVGAIPEMLEDGNEGWIVPPHRPESLAKAMLQIIQDPVRRDIMSRASHRKALARFGVSRFELELMNLYEDLLANDRRRRTQPAATYESSQHVAPTASYPPTQQATI